MTGTSLPTYHPIAHRWTRAITVVGAIVLAVVVVQTAHASSSSAVVADHSLATADLDGDGHSDVVMTSAYDSTVSVLFGNGDGTFRSRTEYPCPGYPVAVAIADLDGNGTSDLVVARLLSRIVSIFPGNGDGSFGVRTDLAAGYGPVGVAIADLDQDGHLDLAVANAHASTVSVFRGDGTGSFPTRTDFETGYDPSSVAIADLNGDGDLDVVVSNWNFRDPLWSSEEGSYIGTISVLLGNGDGTLGSKTDFITGESPRWVAIADLDADGRLDVATANQHGRKFSVLRGAGDGSFGPKTDFATGQGGSVLGIRDLNGDGIADVTVTNYSSSTISMLLGYGNGTFAPRIDRATAIHPVTLAVVELNANGMPDIVVAHAGSNEVSVLLDEALALPPTALPPALQLAAVKPNPSRVETRLQWVLPAQASVDVTVFDIAGRTVRTLLAGVTLPAGEHRVIWDGSDDQGLRAIAGIYFVRVRAGAEARTAKVIRLP